MPGEADSRKKIQSDSFFLGNEIMHHKLQIPLLEQLFKSCLFCNQWKSTIYHSLLRTFKCSETSKFLFPVLIACNFCFLSIFFFLGRVIETLFMLLLFNLLYAVVVFVCRTFHIINACKTYNLWVFFRV